MELVQSFWSIEHFYMFMNNSGLNMVLLYMAPFFIFRVIHELAERSRLDT